MLERAGAVLGGALLGGLGDPPQRGGAVEVIQVRAAPVASAAAAAATPIPFSDAALLVPIQLGMMARIAQIYKIKFDSAALMAIASTTAATQLGRAAFTGLLKMVPGAGTVVGGAVGAGVASTFTYAMGQSWLTLCQRVAKGKLGADAQHAAVAVEHGCTLITTDSDFDRFPELRWRHPLRPQG